MPKVSVVVPVYNVKDYVGRCVESVLCQTEKDWELLLVDDGSTDGSGDVCEKIAGSDSRIRVIHQENRGLGGARNTGIEAAAGRWILFLDSDDWLEPETLGRALGAAESTGSDMAVFAFRSVDESGREVSVFREGLPEDAGLSPKEHKELLLMAPSACTKLYKTELFTKTGVRYPPRVWYEDVRTTTKLVPNCGKIVYTGYIGYNYLQRQGSIMNNANLMRNREIIDAFRDILGWYRGEGLFEEYREELEYLTVFHEYLTASVRVARVEPGSPLLGELRGYIDKEFPGRKGNKYLRTLGRQRQLLRLLDWKMYRTVNALFRIKG